MIADLTVKDLFFCVFVRWSQVTAATKQQQQRLFQKKLGLDAIFRGVEGWRRRPLRIHMKNKQKFIQCSLHKAHKNFNNTVKK